MKTLIKLLAGLTVMMPFSAMAGMGITVTWTSAAPVPTAGPITLAVIGLLMAVIAIRLFPGALARASRISLMAIGVAGLITLGFGSKHAISTVGIASTFQTDTCSDSKLIDAFGPSDFLENNCGNTVITTVDATSCGIDGVEYRCNDVEAPGGDCSALQEIGNNSTLNNGATGVLPVCVAAEA